MGNSETTVICESTLCINNNKIDFKYIFLYLL